MRLDEWTYFIGYMLNQAAYETGILNSATFQAYLISSQVGKKKYQYSIFFVLVINWGDRSDSKVVVISMWQGLWEWFEIS